MSEWFLNFSAWEGGIMDVKVISEWFLNFSARERDIMNVHKVIRRQRHIGVKF